MSLDPTPWTRRYPPATTARITSRDRTTARPPLRSRFFCADAGAPVDPRRPRPRDPSFLHLRLVPGCRGLHLPSRRDPGGSLLVEGGLQDDDSSGLVDHATPLAAVPPHSPGGRAGLPPWTAARRPAAPAADPSVSASRWAKATAASAAGPSRPASVRGRPTTTSTASRSVARRTSSARSPLPRRSGRDGGRDQPRGVAGGDADPDGAHVDPEPHARPHQRSPAHHRSLSQTTIMQSWFCGPTRRNHRCMIAAG